jgi:vancomycin permeability regulator SanA
MLTYNTKQIMQYTARRKPAKAVYMNFYKNFGIWPKHAAKIVGTVAKKILIDSELVSSKIRRRVFDKINKLPEEEKVHIILKLAQKLSVRVD